MRLARFVLAASAVPFAASGLAFLIAPLAMSARIGSVLGDATADSEARAVYGGLQLACAALLAWAARGSAPRLRAGLVAQLSLRSSAHTRTTRARCFRSSRRSGARRATPRATSRCAMRSLGCCARTTFDAC